MITQLKKIFGRDEKFYDLLDSSAEQACNSMRGLAELLSHPDQARATDAFVLLRRKDKKIKEQISEELCRTFVTPMEREDIEALSNALYKIPKTVEKFAERFSFCPLVGKERFFHEQTLVLEKCTVILREMVSGLRNSMGGINQIREQRDQLHFLEGEADKLMLQLFKELYDYNQKPLDVIMLKDLAELLEKIIDRCRDASSIIFHIVLKYS